MTSPIYLAPGESRCTGNACKQPQPCARKLAPYPVGRPVGDFSLAGHSIYVAIECVSPKWAKFIALADAVQPVAKQPAKEWIGNV